MSTPETQTIDRITYGDGGYDETKPYNNIVYQSSQEYDMDGNAIGDPVVKIDVANGVTP